MYPDWPQSAAELEPLPRCDGPKLKPFEFEGPQNIEFLDVLGDGSHSDVFKVNIQGSIYALKLFRFLPDFMWLPRDDYFDADNVECMTIYYNYSDPFCCECRAFGRLQETNNEHLAIRSFGYVLLDEQHEAAVKSQFGQQMLEYDLSEIFPHIFSRDGRPRPIRGIVKELGQTDELLRPRDMQRILRDVIQLQQSGIFDLDVGLQQIVNGRFADFSIACTVPHFSTTPELNPFLTAEQIAAMELNAFSVALSDYQDFDDMIMDYNNAHGNQKDITSVRAVPDAHGAPEKSYNLRDLPSRSRIYSRVNPTIFDWKNAGGARSAGRGSRSMARATNATKPGGTILEPPARRAAMPKRWHIDCDRDQAVDLIRGICLMWEYKDGFMFPHK